MRSILGIVWKRRHRAFLCVRRVQIFLGDAVARVPLPVSVRMILGDLLFLALEATVFNTQTYQNWRRRRTGRGRIHALLGGRDAAADDGDLLPPPVAPAAEEWRRVVPLPSQSAKVDVIVPVYRGYAETLRCLYSVLTGRNRTPFALIVINDASPEAALVDTLRQLAGRGLFTLLDNEENRGFVATVNRGMQLHPERDAVLLNADTEVYGDWLDRLIAHNAPHVGSVTPFSNNAEICSYPYFVRDNTRRLEITPEALDALAATIHLGAKRPLPTPLPLAGEGSCAPRSGAEAGEGVIRTASSCLLPTAVGFCMFIPRACLNAVGYFDEKTFGRGYGEENDFCLRASALGFRHLLAGDVYVRHAGGASFGREKTDRVKHAWNTLKRLHPHYAGEIAAFIAADPPLCLRRALDLARLGRNRGTHNVLMISHALGGGTDRHIRELAEELEHQDTGVFALSPVPESPGLLRLSHMAVPHAPNLIFSLHDEQEAFTEALQAIGITRLHIHHLIQYPEGMSEFVILIAGKLALPYDVTVHDYYLICPRINLTTEEDRYCGEPDIAGCEACIRTRPSHAGGIPVWLWRERFRHLLTGAEHRYVPDGDVSRRMEKHFPALRFEVKPHREAFDGFPALGRKRQAGEPLIVAVLGAISPIKGAVVLEQLVKDANRRKLPVEYVLIGHTGHAPLCAGMPRLTVSGKYEEAEVEALLRRYRPHLLLFPSIWPETYCYTLSYAFRYGIWPVVFDLGAQASRVRARKFGSVLPPDMADDPAAFNDSMLTLEFPAG